MNTISLSGRGDVRVLCGGRAFMLWQCEDGTLYIEGEDNNDLEIVVPGDRVITSHGRGVGVRFVADTKV
jgi:hypothetical protein